ncbi:MarC family protein [Flammeovirga sp. SJP92]|uniref:MarC family protein n=1 Tax=Flammeovirga sp. SJP92 TaxID=1775430 RepID=UPI0007897459|nr:MarC family protein [Flammeovirga sp. SJP92]KXX70645.1 MarC family transcriptional regulator [Flammeovirga sp. SJP92]
MFQLFFTKFIAFFTVIDPIGTIPVFIAVTSKMSKDQKVTIAKKATFAASGVLLFFIAVGEVILEVIKIPMSNFQIAGGIVLFLFALTMIFGASKPEEEISHIDQKDDVAIFPLAMPSLASPGAILAVMLLTEKSKYSVQEQVITSLIMLTVMGLAWLFMLFSSRIFHRIGNSGAALISRVMGLILSAVAVNHILMGLRSFFEN